MAAIPVAENTTVQAIYRAYQEREARAGGHRAHLGASVIGHACERYLWLLFRWAGREAFEGRLLRLFNTGQRAEAHFVDDLRSIGVQVHDVDEFGQQFRVSHVGGHFGGSMDGAALGLPEAPKAWHVTEFKTHNDKSFKELESKGVQEAKPLHYAQMQVYMGLTGMERALYLAENKNTSALYQERVHFDQAAFSALLERARRIIEAPEPAARLSNDPAWFACKWCAMHGICHGQQAPEVNCRTCAHSTPDTKVNGGAWKCERKAAAIDDAAQRQGCAGHRYIPILLERIGEQAGVEAEPDGNAAVVYRMADGRTFKNGAAPNFSSREIEAAEHKSMLCDADVQALKGAFRGAEVVA